jgi:molybdopterin-guanine dinucleotide biosynthesis protein B
MGFLVAFVGSSGSGKTRFIESLLPVLRARGLKVAYVKHCHRGFELDDRRKDSGRAREAGAEVVVLVSREETARIETRRATLMDLADEIGRNVDLVVAEGFKSEPVRKIEVLASDGELCCDSDPYLVAVISDGKDAFDVPKFGTGDVERVADFLGRKIMVLDKSKLEVELVIDGSPVELNDFVRSMLGSAVVAMVSNLRGVKDPGTVKLTITKGEGGEKGE